MIQATVAAATGVTGAESPPELRLYWTCRRYGGLPDTGAIMDQDAGLLSRMAVLSNVYDTVQRVKELHGDDIHRMTANDGRILSWLDEMDIAY